MIPSDVRLFTWVDVEEVLLRAQKRGNWPDELHWANAYWDGVELGIKPGWENQKKVVAWLSDIFDPRFKEETLEILLVSTEEGSRRMSVWFEETEEQPEKRRFIPSLSRSVSVRPSSKLVHPAPLDEELPPVVVFHSFKGGVGRTLMAVTLAQAVAESDDKAKVLLVDGDLEAPGLTWLVKDRFPELPIALSDFLALVHGESDPSAAQSLKLTVENLQSLVLDNIYIMPAFRNEDMFTSLEVRPEHLVQGNIDPYILTSLLAHLGQELGVNAVIVDLRAGLSELSSSLLLDPRVYRVLVTTLSDQSLQGTTKLLELLSDLSLPEKDYEPLPAIIVTKVLRELAETQVVYENIEAVFDAAAPFTEEVSSINEAGTGFGADLPLQIVEHYEDLVTLPAEWSKVCSLLKRHGVIQQLKPLLDWIPLSSHEPTSLELNDEAARNKIRRELSVFTQKLVFAENADVDKFLTIQALHNLAMDFKRKTPLTVIVGPKGSGKTYTYLQLTRRKRWERFAEDALDDKVFHKAHVCPVLMPGNLSDKASQLVTECRLATSEALGLFIENLPVTITDYLRDRLRENLHEGNWREIWLNVIAWSIGFRVQQEDAGKAIIEYLREQKQKVVAVIDGLEDFFQSFENNGAQVALRSLLQDVPEWLRQQPDRPLGLIVFVREDMVTNAIVQNSQQLLAKYEPYALNWEVKEALRLVHWIVSKTRVPFINSNQEIKELSFESLSDLLVPLWGRKLGRERSKEARSARWIIAALSDFKGRIQARDLVRFLKIAAEKSLEDDYWKERILVPTAIRLAVKECGDAKIDELGQETPELEEIFNILNNVADERRYIPFAPPEVGLSANQIDTLESSGIVTQEEGKYYLAELFRRSLGFKSVGRSKVLKLARRTWQSVD
jgi:MinD-like ATPase involved in chromosome partitioning or flagellar assembly